MEIFISYRRADSQDFTKRLYERLAGPFGGNVFLDVEKILPGRDFPLALESITKNCNVMLIVIGKDWERIMKERSASAEDWVRFEVETGLNRRDILVIPVLTDGAQMPKAQDLPASIQELPRRNGSVVNDGEKFEQDIEKLIKMINEFGYLRISGTASTSFYLRSDSDRDARMIGKIQKGEEIIIVEYNRDKTWAHVVKENSLTEGWAATEDFKLITKQPIQSVKELSVNGGFGARLAYGQLFFTNPQKRSGAGSGGSDSQFGIDVQLAEAIKRSTSSVDVAAFEFNNKELTEAILDVKERGIQVRMVTDKKNGLEKKESAFHSFIKAGIPVVCRESSSGLMHNKFTILDGKTVWTGSWNYTQGGTYRNNENSIAFDAPEIATLYRNKFEEMFTQKKFGGKASKDNLKKVSALGIPVEVCFTPDQTIGNYICTLILSARKSVHFMMFAFTDVAFGNAILNCHAHGVQVFGIQEGKNANVGASEFKKLTEAGVEVRYDGNPYMLNHAIVVIDKTITITGSMNFTTLALKSNDENVIIVHDLVLAELYLEEFERQWQDGKAPNEVGL